jgi:hypothetical protein
MKRRHVKLEWVVLALLVPSVALAALQLRYDREYAVIGYSTNTPTDAVTALRQEIARGGVRLEYDAKSGYLAALLRALHIGVDSQILAFSKTSFQAERISPQAPRAIYFNDDVYVAWVQGSEIVEIAAVDPVLGIVFHTLDRGDGETPRFRRQTTLCLECHDSYSLTGGGVPRFIVGSGPTGETGDLASHESWRLTSHETPLARRWGGWYVTGTHGGQLHLGNLIVRGADDLSAEARSDAGNLLDLRSVIDTDPYLAEHSDIVALMVIEHQTHVQNAIIRAGWDTRRAIDEEQQQTPPPGLVEGQASESVAAAIAGATEPLVEALLMVNEAPLTGPLTGTSGFADSFAAAGPVDTRGRSLRQLDLSRRLLQYPCSYLIYSDSFDGLPVPAKDYVYRRLVEVLSGQDSSGRFDHLSAEDRGAILEILTDTKPDFAARQAGD